MTKTTDLRQMRRRKEVEEYITSKKFRYELFRKLNTGEREYKTLPSFLKCQRGVVLNAKFQDIFEFAPESAWRDRYFLKSIWINLEEESKIRYNISNYTRFIDKINDKTIIEDLIRNKEDGVMKNMILDYIKYGRVIL